MTRHELITRLQNDTRTREEIFQEMVEQMKEMCGGNMSDGEAAEAVRNVIGFCTTLLQGNIDSARNRAKLDHGAIGCSGVS